MDCLLFSRNFGHEFTVVCDHEGMALKGGCISVGLDTVGSLASGFISARIDEELLSSSRTGLGNGLA